MVKELMKCIREYKKPSILAPILVSLEVVMECTIPFLIAMLVNQIKAGAEFSILVKYGLLLIVMATLSLMFGIGAGNACATASCGFAKNVRKDLYAKIQEFSFENIDKFSSSSLVTRLTTDVTNVQNAYMMIVRIAVRCPLMFLFAFVMAFIMGGKMACIFLLVVPVLGFGLYMVIRTAMPLFRKVFHKYDELNNSIQENIKGMRVVKSYVREDFEKEKFDRAAGDVCEDFTKAEKILAWNNPLMQFSLYTVMIFVLTVGSYVIITTKGLDLDVGQFSALLTYSFQILSSLMMLSMVFVMITLANESAHRIVEVLKEESSLKNPAEPVYEVADGSIDFENVSFSYSKKAKRKALADINLHIRSGETIGIIGGTGSGKSTLVSLIPRFYDVTEGSVSVEGINVKEYPFSQLREKVGMVPQLAELFSGTIASNLRWGNAHATQQELENALRIAQAKDFVDRLPLGLESPVSQGGKNFSGGQKQRLTIARALAGKPEILILDDSASALDFATDAALRRALKAETQGMTVLMVSQRVSTVKAADRILVLDDGTMAGLGTHEELMESCEVYREICLSQLSREEAAR